MTKYILAYSETLNTYDSIEAAKEAGKKLANPNDRHILIYAVEPAGIVNPVLPITDNDEPPGGTPVALAVAA